MTSLASRSAIAEPTSSFRLVPLSSHAWVLTARICPVSSIT